MAAPIKKLSWYQRLGRWILENRIKANLTTHLQTIIQQDGMITVDPASPLFIWLSLAKLCASKTEKNANLLTYQFSTNQSLAAFLIAEQESPKAKKLIKQNATLNFALLYNTQNSSKPQELNTELSSFQRLFKWFFVDALNKGNAIGFDMPGFTNKVVFTRLRNMSEKAPKENNHQAPGQHIVEPRSLKASLFKDTLKTPIPSKETLQSLPDVHFQRIIELDVNQSTQQTQATDVQANQALNLDIVLDVSTEQFNEQQVWVDQSILLDASEVINLLFHNRVLESTSYWLSGLESALAENKGIQRNQLRFTVSENAKKMLISAGGYITTNFFTLDTEHLPLGFFVEENKDNHFSLKYDDNLRAQQIKNPHLANLRLDPKENNGRQARVNSEPAYEIKFLNQIKNTRLTYSSQQKQFFANLDQKEIWINRFYSLNSIFYTALDKILNTSSNTSEQINQFIDAMINLDGQTMPEFIRNTQQLETKFHFFARYFLYNLTEGNVFFSPAAWQYLERFIEEKEPWVLLLFYTLVNSGIRVSYNEDFLQIARRVYYLGDYLKHQGIRIQPDPQYQASVFDQPELLMECLTLVKKKHPLLLPWIGEHISYFPRDLIHAKALLNADYSFLHQSMNIAIWNNEQLMPAKLSEQKLNKASKPDKRRAYFLRYLATEVADTHVLTLLAFWEKTIGSLDEIVRAHKTSWSQKLDQHWPSIVNRLMQTPKRLGNEDITKTEAPVNNIQNVRTLYNLNDLDELCASLSSQTEFLSSTQWDQLKQDIKSLNEQMEKYALLSPEGIIKDVAGLKVKFNKVQALALMREVHYRNTYNASDTNPKQGQWVRLEQLLAISIAYEYQVSLEIDTAEGKTLIVGWTALLKALSGQKGDVLSHNQSSAKEGAQTLASLASLFKIKLGHKEQPTTSVNENTDIVFADIATMVLSDLQFPFATQRESRYVLLDEGDNIIQDIQADTTFQLSDGVHEADGALVNYLMTLNTSIRTGKEISLALLQEQYPECNWSNEEFSFWLKATQSAAKLKRNEDYVVRTDSNNKQFLSVYIVHKKTTGTVDKLSKWSDGLHSCVAAWERKTYANVIVPNLSLARKKGDVHSYLQSYGHRALFTGTLGGEKAIKLTKEIIKSPFCLHFPRAKRPINTKEFERWPSVVITEEERKSIYSRTYRFSPILCRNDTAHKQYLLQAAQAVQAQGNSALFMYNTIDECEKFANFLRENNISDSTIQIFDDARDEHAAAQNLIRPDEKTIMLRSDEPRMITIGTARAGRAENFINVTYCFICKIDSNRGVKQKVGRVGRNMNLGIAYEIYSMDDSNTLQALALANNHSVKSPFFFQKGINTLQEQMETNMLNQIENKSKERKLC